MQIKSDQSAKDGLLFTILSTIYMLEPETKTVDERCLKSILSKFGVDLESRREHPIFGNVKMLITKDFAGQGWLKVTRDPSDHTIHGAMFYALGWRARMILPREEMVDFIYKLNYGEDHRGLVWIEQMEIAKAEDAEIKESRELPPVPVGSEEKPKAKSKRGRTKKSEK